MFTKNMNKKFVPKGCKPQNNTKKCKQKIFLQFLTKDYLEKIYKNYTNESLFTITVNKRLKQ